MLTIDGSEGEGGGQIIRSSLALAAVTGKEFRAINIRANRKSPGLLKQHLTAVNAAREICGAGVTGVELKSSEFTFAPGPVQSRGFRFSIGSAGSTSLVAQTVLPALMVANGKSSIEIEGGTHNMAAPPFDFLDWAYLPQLERMGPRFERQILAHGFFPAGGGRIRIEIEPAQTLIPLKIPGHGKGDVRRTITAVISRLPQHVAERELKTIRHQSGWKNRECEIRSVSDSPGPGNCLMIRLQHPNVTEVFTAFGRKGITAEQVAKSAWRQVVDYQLCGAPVGEHLADQLMLPMAIAASQGHASTFRTGKLSGHSETHIKILKKFLDIDIRVIQISKRNYEVAIG